MYKIQEPLLDYININNYYFGVSIYIGIIYVMST